jgi:hypothetical protein
MAVIDFTDLQSLSGYRQVSKVIEWLKENRVVFVVGGDGTPRTTDDMLPEALRERLRAPSKDAGREGKEARKARDGPFKAP